VGGNKEEARVQVGSNKSAVKWASGVAVCCALSSLPSKRDTNYHVQLYSACSLRCAAFISLHKHCTGKLMHLRRLHHIFSSYQLHCPRCIPPLQIRLTLLQLIASPWVKWVAVTTSFVTQLYSRLRGHKAQDALVEALRARRGGGPGV